LARSFRSLKWIILDSFRLAIRAKTRFARRAIIYHRRVHPTEFVIVVKSRSKLTVSVDGVKKKREKKKKKPEGRK